MGGSSDFLDLDIASLRYWILFFWILVVFFGILDTAFLLIQRCEALPPETIFFDEGLFLPDERRFWPTTEQDGTGQ
jgi:hypothetical protein